MPSRNRQSVTHADLAETLRGRLASIGSEIKQLEQQLTELLGRTYENIDNAFEAEQRVRLRRREYQAFGDTAITALGDRLVQRGRLLMFVNVAASAVLVLLVAFDVL